MRKLTRRASVVSVGVALATTVGVAFAAWTSTGSGTGTAASEAISNVTYSATTAGAKLYPTGSGDVTFTAANPNKYKVTLSAFSMTNAYFSSDTGHTTDVRSLCGLSFSTSATPTVNGQATAASITLTNALSMSNAADQSCASETFDVQLTSTATSTP